ncbi:MAG: hypothetical protein IH940_02310 [Acidobacteria bacterium]|nr:hypothetical protein [Acidobacteriota bacterium]
MNTEESIQRLIALLLDGELHHGSFVAGIEPTLGGLHCEMLEILDHPIADLAGFEAPASWECVGIVAEGSATSIDNLGTYGDDPVTERRCRLCVVVDRFGTQMSELRMLGSATQPVRSDSVYGLVVDAARRCLGLETDPAHLSPSTIGAWAWVDAVVSETIERDVPLKPDEIDALHPFATLSGPVDIAELRRAVSLGTIELDGISPIEAKWCDDGAFARWWMYQLLDLDELYDLAGAVLDAATMSHLGTDAAYDDLFVGPNTA